MIDYAAQCLFRLVFILYSGLYQTYSFAELSKSFIYGIPLDLAFTGYLILCQFVLFSIVILLNKKIILKIILGLNTLIFSLATLLAFGDGALYKVWGSRVNHDVFNFLGHPTEAFATMQLGEHLIPIFISIAMLFFSYLLFKKVISKAKTIEFKKYLIFQPLLFGLAVILARGGVGTVPVLASSVFKSKAMPINVCSLNSGWNFIYFAFNDHKPVGLDFYEKLAGNFGLQESDKYFGTDSTGKSLVKIAKPNVVLIVVESLNAYASKLFGDGSQNNTPFIDDLARNGYYFNKCYSPIDRTPRAMAAIHSGFPGLPWGSILEEPVKASKLPMLPKCFANAGYTTSFMYGGDINFADIGAYLFNSGYQSIRDINNFNNAPKDKWGVRDEILFDSLLVRLNATKQPFFSGILTLSSHEPFAVPAEYTKGLGADKNNVEYFFASVRYTDNCLKQFFEKAKKQAWYKNTLFVICADHGRRVGVEKPETESVVTHKIPLLFYGEVLQNAFQGQENKLICSQTDLAQTLLSSVLQSKAHLFPFSRNLVSSSVPQMSFYYNGHGFGLFHAQGVFDFNVNNSNVTIENTTKAEDKEYEGIAKSFQYSLVKYYWSLK